MGKYRSRADRKWAIVKWWRRKNAICPFRARYDQEPLPRTQVGDYIMVWDEKDEPWDSPPASPRRACNCSGSHTPVPSFLIVRYLLDSLYCVASHMNDLTVKFKIFQPSIIFNLGQHSPNSPGQTFEMLTKAQRRLIVETLTKKEKGPES